MLLEIRNLTVRYRRSGDDWDRPAVSGLWVAVEQGEKLAVVGESGAGKTTIAHAVMGILPPMTRVEGEIVYRGQRIDSRMPEGIRGKEIVLIPQNAYNSLNPVLPAGTQLEDLQAEDGVPSPLRRQQLRSMLQRVRLTDPDAVLASFPHQLSGGMKQRVLLAMGLLREPRLIIADEPTKGLDPVRRLGVLELLKDLLAQKQQSLMLITHDIRAAVFLCDTVVMMYRGELVEKLPVSRLYEYSSHPYTIALLNASPQRGLQAGQNAGNGISTGGRGCSYVACCSQSVPVCGQERPVWREIYPGHLVRCHVVA